MISTWASYAYSPPQLPAPLTFQTQRGRVVDLRPVGWSDTPLLADFLGRLSKRSLLQRYFTPVPFHVPEVARQEALRLSERDPSRRLVAVATAGDRIIGVAELARDQRAPWQAEAALVVADDYQNEGIGGAFCARLVELAEQRGITLVLAMLLPHNRAARRLIDGLDVPYTSDTARGVTTVQLSVPKRDRTV